MFSEKAEASEQVETHNQNNASPGTAEWSGSRLLKLPKILKVVVGLDLVFPVASLFLRLIFLLDLEYLAKGYLMNVTLLDPSFYYGSKAHFWLLFGCSWDAHLDLISIVPSGYLVWGIIKMNHSSIEIWIKLRKLLTALKLLPSAAVFLGGPSPYAYMIAIFYISFCIFTMVSVEMVARYYANKEANRAENS